MRRHAFGRVKIEAIPSLFCIALVALFFYIIFLNVPYWPFVDDIAASIFHARIPFIFILLTVLGAVGIFCIVYLFISIFRLDVLLNRVLNTVPVAALAFMVFIMAIVFNYTDRFNLGGIFWLAGERGDYIYFAIVFGTVAIAVLTITGTVQAFKESPAGKGKYEGKRFHHRYTAIMTVMADALVLPLLVLMAFYHPRMTAYWNTVTTIMTNYFSWSSIPVFMWGAFWIGSLATMRARPGRTTSSTSTTNTARSKDRLMNALFWGSMAGQLVGLLMLGIQTEIDTAPLAGLGSYVVLPFAALSVIPVLPWIGTLIGRLMHPLTLRLSKPKLVLSKLLVLAIIIFPIYWMVFFQPMALDPITIDLPPTAHVSSLNGINVPFEGDVVYPSFEMQSNASREYLDLTGTWKFSRVGSPEPASLAPRTGRFMPRITQGQHLPGYDDSGWDPETIPGGYATYNPGKYNGVSWFRRVVTIPTSFENRTILMKFNGGAAFTDVWIDGHYVGYHEYCHTSFSFDVTQWINPGVHLFAIRTDSAIASGLSDDRFKYRIFPDFGDVLYSGGLDRLFYLEAAPGVMICRADVKMGEFATANHLNGTAEIMVDVVVGVASRVRSADLTGTLSMSIHPLFFPNETTMRSLNTWEHMKRNESIITTQTAALSLAGQAGTRYAAHRFVVTASGVHFWSTKRPNLYAVEINLTSNDPSIPHDVFVTQTGFRNFTTTGENLTLNGADLKLGGASVFFLRNPPIAQHFSPDDFFNQLLQVKNASVNFMRLGVLDPVMYLYADRLGIVVDEEPTVHWANDVNLLLGRTRGIFGHMWTETVFRDKNRPSVLFWGGCNEPWATTSLWQYLKWLRDFLTANDAERILVFACASSQDWNPAYQYLRVCTPNVYGGTFEGEKLAFEREIGACVDRYHAANPGKPIINLEWGYWREGANMLKCYREGMNAYMNRTEVAGCTWFAFNDAYTCCAMGLYDINNILVAPEVLAEMQVRYATFTAGNL